MLTLLASLAFAQALPLPELNPSPPPVLRERGHVAHTTATAGLWTTVGSLGLGTVSLIPATACLFASSSSAGCTLTYVGVGAGIGGVATGLTLQGIGGYAYLQRQGRGRRFLVVAGAVLAVGGAAGVGIGASFANDLGLMVIPSAQAFVAGVLLLDVQHVVLRRKGDLAWAPTFDPRARTVGVAGQFR